MKGLLVVVGVLAVGVALFVGVLRFAAGKGVDAHAEMTQSAAEVVVTESAPEENRRYSQSRGFRVTYRYALDGRWYGSNDWVPEEIWEPNRNTSLQVCLDPEDPAEHVVVRRIGARCGDGTVGSADIQRAETTTAPD